MVIFRYVGSILTVAGSGTVSTQNFNGGLLRHIFIQAQTSGTTFQANIQDPEAFTIKTYGATVTTINDNSSLFPVAGPYTVNVTNANTNGTFQIRFMIQEN